MDSAMAIDPWEGREGARSRPHVILLILAAAFACHAAGWNYIGYDVGRWLLPWYGHIQEHGRLGAFAAPFSNYSPPYLYLLSFASLADGLLSPVAIIKLLSVAGTVMLAAALYHLLGALKVSRRGEKAALVLLLPTTLLNAPVLGQCDAMWAAAAICAVAEAVRARPVATLLWCGLAVAVKLQAIFLAPFIIAWLLAERIPLRLWLLPIFSYGAAMAPAWLLGWPAADLVTIYLRQAQYFNTIGNAANPWIFAGALRERAFELFWVGYALGLVAIAAFTWYFARRRLDSSRLVLAALLSSMILPFLLPKMHERYFFLADILALVYAWTARTREGATIAIAVQAASLLALLGYFLSTPVYPMLGCMLLMLALAAISREFTPAARTAPRGAVLSA